MHLAHEYAESLMDGKLTDTSEISKTTLHCLHARIVLSHHSVNTFDEV
jgi:hypothetical protein